MQSLNEPPATDGIAPAARPFRYEEIARDLRERIARGEYAASGRLPAERALMQEFRVQRDTVRRALEVLEAERRIFRDTTRGTFVSPGLKGVPSGAAGPAPAALRSVLVAVRRGGDARGPAALLRGLSEALGSQGLPVLWHDTRSAGAEGAGNARESLLPPLEMLSARGIAGAAVWPEMPAPLARLRSIRAAMPLVVVDRRVPEFESDFVGFADEDGGRAVTQHLLSLGHHRIGFVSGEPGAESVRARERGWAAALRAAGIAPRPEWSLHAGTGVRNPPPPSWTLI